MSTSPTPQSPTPQTNPQSPAPASPVTSSGTLIVLGVVLAGIGQLIYANGQQAALEAALSPSVWTSDDGSGALIFGGILSLIGLVLGLVGIARLCRRVDFIYQSMGGK